MNNEPAADENPGGFFAHAWRVVRQAHHEGGGGLHHAPSLILTNSKNRKRGDLQVEILPSPGFSGSSGT
ncbi:hypothetical protein, partial [Escherichia coli]|uniref:hypothetical protein n=1 Tax=Escherichia coli TaxID=562 RepID=UPI001BE46054